MNNLQDYGIPSNCPKCGSKLEPDYEPSGNKTEVFMQCEKCGYRKKYTEEFEKMPDNAL